MTDCILGSKYVADTVAIILHLEKRKMSELAHRVFTKIEKGSIKLYIPTMVFAEIMYLAERKRIQISLVDVHNYLQEYTNCVEVPLTLEIVEKADIIDDIPELHDRLIDATAAHLTAPLITNDVTISSSRHLETLW